MANQLISGTGAARAPEDPTNHPNNAFFICCLDDDDAFHEGLTGKFIKIEGGAGFPSPHLYHISGFTRQNLGAGVKNYLSLSEQVPVGATGGNWSIVIGQSYVDGTSGSNMCATPFGAYYLADTDSPLSADDVGLQITLTANDLTEGLVLAEDYWIVDCPSATLAGPYDKRYPIFTLARVAGTSNAPPALTGMRSVGWQLKSGVGARLPKNTPDYSVTWRKKILLVGDSRTYALGTDHVDSDPNFHNPGNRYRDALREMFPNCTVQDTDVVNVGVRGSTSTQWRQGTANYNTAVAALQAMGNPDLVDVDLGMNQGDGQTIEEYVDDLQSFAEGIQAIFPGIIIILNEPAWTWDPARDPAWNEACKNALRLVGRRTVLGTLEEQNHSKATKGLQPDGVHSNSIGQLRDARHRVRGAAPYLNGTKTIPPVDNGGGENQYTLEQIAAAVRAEMDANSTQLAKLGTPANESLADDIAEVNNRAIALPSAATIAGTLFSNPANKLATNSSGQVQASSLSGYVAPNNAGITSILTAVQALPVLSAITEGIRKMPIIQRMASKVAAGGLSRTKNGNVTTDTAPREDGGETVFTANATTGEVTVTDTPGNGSGWQA